jgi:signal transduction histidine kinase
MATLQRGILGRHSVRARIAFACGGLFLVTGAAFLAATYALVDHSLGTSAADMQRNLVAQSCGPASLGGHLAGSAAARATCKVAIALGVHLGATDQRARDLHELLLWSAVGLAVATVAAGLLGWATGGRILLPLHKVTAAARRASQEHLDERIDFGGPRDELKELADTFDDMLNRLDVAFASQRRFVANASHELRTPLTAMRTLIDVAMAKPTRSAPQLEQLVARVRDSLDQSEKIIDGLLVLARSDRGLSGHQAADLEVAAQDAIDQVGPAARQANVGIDSDLSPAPTLGDRVLLERLAVNLLDNAVRYNVDGGTVTVMTGTDGDVSYLTVANTGPHVPPSAVATLFEPFTRLDGRIDQGKAVGLGLSIVTSVVSAHHGTVEALSLPGGGMRISARLPKDTGVPTDEGDASRHLDSTPA